MNSKEQGKSIELARQIGLITVISCGIGSMIGSGIFKKPGVMATQLDSPELLVLVWIVAGFMTLFGSLSIAEISGMFSDSGGQYAYFNRSYNRFVGYLYGWAVFAIIQTGSIAGIAYVFSDSLGYFLQFPRLSPSFELFALHIPFLGDITPFKFIGLKLSTIALITFLTTVNYLGVKLGSAVQVLFTSMKVLTIAAIILLAFALGNGNSGNLVQSALSADTSSVSVFLAFIVAMSGAFWAYDGWINVTYISGEIRNVQRTLPRGMFVTAVTVMAVYILPVSDMAARYLQAEAQGQSYLVATDVARTFWGEWSGSIIAMAIMISTFGAVNGTIMMTARVNYSMAREGLFFRKIGEINPRFMTPGPSLILQGVWAAILVLSGTFDQLTDMLIFVSWIFYAAAAFGVVVLRRRMPDAPRPYKVWGYPWVTYAFVFFSMIYVVFTLYSDITNYMSGRAPLINSLMGVVLVALGIPGYLYWNRQQGKRNKKFHHRDTENTEKDRET
ncbi:MAG: APC family permease, partial [Candidatus Latescibacterota bacterium]